LRKPLPAHESDSLIPTGTLRTDAFEEGLEVLRRRFGGIGRSQRIEQWVGLRDVDRFHRESTLAALPGGQRRRAPWPSRAPPPSAGVWSQVAELKGSDIVAGDAFGLSVSISGKTAIVGSSPFGFHVPAGRAYVFAESAGIWKQVAELKGSDSRGDDGFGGSVAISGATAIVGVPIHTGYGDRSKAYVFTDTAGAWKQIAELQVSPRYPVSNDYFGYSVAMSENTAVVGTGGTATSAGHAWVFSDAAGVWKEVAELKGSDAVGAVGFGHSVAVFDATAIVGAPDHASNTAYVFGLYASTLYPGTGLRPALLCRQSAVSTASSCRH
jgi:hypothetical protein